MRNFIFRNQKVIFPTVTVLLTLGVTILGAEITLRFFEKRFIYVTADLNKVVTGIIKEGGFLKKNFNGYVIDSFGNDILWINNSDGFRNEKEFSREPNNGVLRILSLGDSFTAGYRIDQKKTFSFLMEKWIEKKFGKAEVMIAWTEQPGLVLKYVKEFGQHYHPDVVFLGITMANDIIQAYSSKLGVDYFSSLHHRVVADDCLRKRNLFGEAKWAVNFIYTRLRFIGLFYDQPRAVSSRHKAYRKPKLFDTHHALGFFISPSPPIIKDAYKEVFLTISELKKFLDHQNIDLIVSIFPQRFQISPEDWDLFVYEYGLQESCFDLLHPNKLFQSFCEKNNIFCIDGTRKMQLAHSKMDSMLYQPRGDTHWNSLGNQIFFDSIRPSLNSYLEKNKDRFWTSLN